MNYNVLIVDDEESFLWALNNYFMVCDFNVMTATTAEAGLRILESSPIHVVLTDVKMPGMGGMPFLDKIIEYDFTIQVIVMTGYGTFEMARGALTRGASDFILKPFDDLDDIALLISQAAQRHFRWKSTLGHLSNTFPHNGL